MDEWQQTTGKNLACRVRGAVLYSFLLSGVVVTVFSILFIPGWKTLLSHELFMREGLGVVTFIFLLRVGLLWVFLFSLSIYLYQEAKKKRSNIQVVRGTKILSPKAFQKEIEGDGLGIPLKTRKTHSPSTQTDWLRIRKADEASHLMVVGDTGKGKSALFHHFLMQVRERNETAIIYDPALEFYRAHGKEDDILLYPPSSRCPHWTLKEELSGPGLESSLSVSFLPGRGDIEDGKDFFTPAARAVLSHLLLEMKRLGGSTELLTHWLSNPEEILTLVEGTPLQSVISRDAPEQRAGVLGSLSLMAGTLRQIPSEKDHEGFSFHSWSMKTNRPWIFLGNMVSDRDALTPLISAWLDVAFRTLTRDGLSPTWIFLDELRTLRRLPYFPTALQEGRKFGLKFVLGFQGRSQLETLWGKEAEALMSAPATRIFLGTKEHKAALWSAENLGMPETERGTTGISTSVGEGRDSLTLGSERRVETLILPDEIKNLKSLEGFLRYQEYLTKFSFSYPDISLSSLEDVLQKKKLLLPAPENTSLTDEKSQLLPLLRSPPSPPSKMSLSF